MLVAQVLYKHETTHAKIHHSRCSLLRAAPKTLAVKTLQSTKSKIMQAWLSHGEAKLSIFVRMDVRVRHP
jgi:hypothetical protein